MPVTTSEGQAQTYRDLGASRTDRPAPANAEHKFRDPNGIVFDISTHGWDGANG